MRTFSWSSRPDSPWPTAFPALADAVGGRDAGNPPKRPAGPLRVPAAARQGAPPGGLRPALTGGGAAAPLGPKGRSGRTASPEETSANAVRSVIVERHAPDPERSAPPAMTARWNAWRDGWDNA